MTISVPCRCPMCGATTVIECDAQDLQKYMRGTLIQHAFPWMDIHARETLISGMCTPCQLKFFEVDDDDYDEEDACTGGCNGCDDPDCPLRE